MGDERQSARILRDLWDVQITADIGSAVTDKDPDPDRLVSDLSLLRINRRSGQ